ncbi:hypothetical protein N0V85_004680, partial [Neurospora sp. IMI 360204]
MSSSTQNPQSPKSPKSKATSPAPAAAPAPLSAEAQDAAGILPATYWTEQLLPEEDVDDGASSLGSFTSTTASLSSSIYQYREVHGRTYHAEIGNAESWEPNDKRHVDAMEIVDFADEFPNAEVIGTDVTPIQPSWVPPNVQFELEDCNQQWSWPDNTFDFINLRSLMGVVDDWDALYRNAYRVAKPGGYVECYTTSSQFLSDDGSIKEGGSLDQWGKVFREGGKKLGRTFSVYEEDLQRKCMEAAGFVDIEFKDISVPIGVWHPEKKEAEKGLWWKLAVEADLE